jgi:hypothetical protein
MKREARGFKMAATSKLALDSGEARARLEVRKELHDQSA